MSKRTAPEVNAGSMADIAFLLLIFFLVTTTIEKDEGIPRGLPKAENNIIIDLYERNVFEIRIGESGDLFVENELISIVDLKENTIAFLDNGGIPDGQEAYCSYCLGSKDPLSSDNPQKAVISISTHREAPYETYIKVQNELTAAYNELRNRESQRLYNYQYTEMKRAFDDGALTKGLEKTKEELKNIRDLFPMLISEAEIKALYQTSQ